MAWYYLSAPPPAPPAGQSILLAPSVSEAVSAGPFVARSGTDESGLVAKLFRRPDLATSLATLSGAKAKRFRDELNEPGSGSLSLLNDDAGLALIEDGDLIAFEANGTRAWVMLAQGSDRASIDQGEEAGEATVVSGPGHLAILAEARVYPARGVDQLPAEIDRVFSWASYDYDDSAWATATETHQAGTVTAYHALLEGWPDATAWYIWAAGWGLDYAPAGTCYFRKDFTVPASGDDALQLLIFLGADDTGMFYLDGTAVLDTTGNRWDNHSTYTKLVDVTAGAHVVAGSCENAFPDQGPAHPNPAGLLGAGYLVVNGVITELLWHTDASWKIVEYAEPPGMTVGEVMRHAIAEAQARGALLGVVPMFTDDTDSNGDPWAEVTDCATKVGCDCLAFFRELCATYCDMWMGPGGLELYAYARDGRGTTVPASLHRPTNPAVPSSGNLRSLNHKRDGAISNVALVRWSNGWHEVADDDSVAAYGRRESLLGLGAAQSIPEVERVASRQLEVYASPREAITPEVEPNSTADTPYLGYTVGDTITVPAADWSPVQERVMALTVEEDDNGYVRYVPELKSVLLAGDERFALWLKKMADGTMTGTSKAATPVAQISQRQSAPDCCPPVPPVGGS
jgi:hypothetical protein